MFVQKNELWNIRTSLEGIRSVGNRGSVAPQPKKNMLILTSPLIIYQDTNKKKNMSHMSDL